MSIETITLATGTRTL